MALSIGIFELAIARTMRRLRHVADEWFFAAAGAASIAFALTFLAFGFRWIKLDPGAHWDLLWFSSYFGFSALCMLALRLHSLGLSRSGPPEILPALGNPKHAY